MKIPQGMLESQVSARWGLGRLLEEALDFKTGGARKDSEQCFGYKGGTEEE